MKNHQPPTEITPFWRDVMQRFERKFAFEKKETEQEEVFEVAIYARVSTEEQAQGYSIEEQVRVCSEYAASRGWRVRNVYRDEGYSGFNGNRPAFKLMQKRDIKTGKVQAVLSHKLDRTYRNVNGMLRTFDDWLQRKIMFISVQEQIDFTNWLGRFFLMVLAYFAEMFIHNLRDETKKGLMGRHNAGLHNGPIPYGYCNGKCSACADANGEDYCPRFGMADIHNEKYAVPHPVDSLAVRYAFELYNSGNYSDRDIADLLNAFQVALPDGERVQARSRGKPGSKPAAFGKDMVRDLLQNPFYAGGVSYYGSEFDGKKVVKYTRIRHVEKGLHIPLISEAIYERALVIRQTKGKAPQGKGRGGKQRGKGKDKPRSASRVYILSGLLDCRRCGMPMNGQSGGGNTRRHVCSTRLQRKEGCDQVSVKADILEAALTAQMAQIHLPEEWREAVIGYLLDDEGLENIQAQRKALQAHFDEIKYLSGQGEITRKAYLRELRYYHRQMKNLSLDDDQSDLDFNRARSLLADFSSLWRLTTPLEKKMLAQTLLNKCDYDNQRIVAWHWYPPFQQLFPQTD